MTQTVFSIRGEVNPAGNRLYVDGRAIDVPLSARLLPSDRSGFEWGYYGKGADLTAAALCSKLFGSSDYAARIWQAFKEEIVANWPYGESFTQELDVTDFLLDHHAELRSSATESVDGRSADGPVDEEAQVHKTQEPLSFSVGDLVRIRLPHRLPALALVYQCYGRGTLARLDGEGYGISLLSADGVDLSGWEPSSWMYLERLTATNLDYQFTTTARLLADYQHGYFAPYFAQYITPLDTGGHPHFT